MSERSERTMGTDIRARHLLIAQRLRQRRDYLGLTQKQIVTRLARCGLRTTNRALSSLEHGAGLDVAKLPELAAALDCTVTYLVGLTNDPHSWQPAEPQPVLPRPAVAPDYSATNAARRPPAPSRAAMQDFPSAESLILGLHVPDRRLAVDESGAPLRIDG